MCVLTVDGCCVRVISPFACCCTPCTDVSDTLVVLRTCDTLPRGPGVGTRDANAVVAGRTHLMYVFFLAHCTHSVLQDQIYVHVYSFFETPHTHTAHRERCIKL